MNFGTSESHSHKIGSVYLQKKSRRSDLIQFKPDLTFRTPLGTTYLCPKKKKVLSNVSINLKYWTGLL
jgi:hypothetical protein